MKYTYTTRDGEVRPLCPLSGLILLTMGATTIPFGFWAAVKLTDEVAFSMAMKGMAGWIVLLFCGLLPVSYLEQRDRMPERVQRFAMRVATGMLVVCTLSPLMAWALGGFVTAVITLPLAAVGLASLAQLHRRNG